MGDRAAWDMLEGRIKSGNHACAFDLVDNSQLPMFYVTKFMQENVYYHSEMDTYVIAEEECSELVISMVISPEKNRVDLKELAKGFGPEIKKVTLGFSPVDREGMDVTELEADDCTFFVRGEKWKVVEEKELMVPGLAHA